MLSFLAPYRLLIGLTAAAGVLGYVGVLKFEVAALRATQAMLEHDVADALGKFGACRARLNNILEARESDATVPDDLDSYTVPLDWLLDANPD